MRTAILVPFLLAATLGAQTSAVVPTWAAATEGNKSSYFPYIYDFSRTQMVVAGGAFCNSAAQITSVEMRRDGLDPAAYNGRSIVQQTVTVGYAATTPSTMSATFASNRGANQTVVLSGAYNLPQQPPAGSPAPFNVPYPFGSPFLYIRAQGDLLIEVVVPGVAMRKDNYYLDAEEYASGAGSVTSYGVSGPVQRGDSLTGSCSTATLTPGGSASTTIAGATQPYPCLHWIGSSSTSFFGLGLPFHLAPVGAPNNHLYASIALMTPVVMTGGPGRYTGTTNWPIPNDPGLGGATVFAQWLILDPPSNAAGIVTTHGLQLRLGGSTAAPLLNLVGQSDSTTPTGGHLFGSTSAGGPVIRLLGVFG